MLSAFFAVHLFASPACIEARRQVGDTTPSDTSDTLQNDTSPGDSLDTPDDGTVSNDLVPVDTVDTLIGPDTHECDHPSDCEPETPDACVEFACVGFRCVSTPKDDVPCSDVNACTEGDTCHNGVCRPGDAVDCSDFEGPCWDVVNKTCDPTGGCGVAARPRGAECDDGRGPGIGKCEKGWRIPADTCDGQGQCVDRSGQVPETLHPLAGIWHLVISTAPTGRDGFTVRALATFDNQGGFVLTRVISSRDGSEGFVEGAQGTYCTALVGETILEIGSISLTARVDKASEVMILAELDPSGPQKIHGVAIRGGGSTNMVSGTYRLVSTALHQGTTGSLMTWQGHVGLSDGCVSDAGSISTGGGLGLPHSFDVSISACFFASDGNQRLLTRLLPPGSATPGAGDPVSIQWTGAIGVRGDILLMTRDDGGLRYGIILLVKDRPSDRANLFGDFAFVSVTGGIGSSNQPIAAIVPRLEHGLISYKANAVVSGAVSSGEQVGPGWWWTALLGSRYAHRASFAGRVLEHSGWVSRSDGFVMGWRVSTAGAGSLPMILDLTPYEGSLFLGVKNADFRITSGTPE